jgi:hypothetical protein
MLFDGNAVLWASLGRGRLRIANPSYNPNREGPGEKFDHLGGEFRRHQNPTGRKTSFFLLPPAKSPQQRLTTRGCTFSTVSEDKLQSPKTSNQSSGMGVPKTIGPSPTPRACLRETSQNRHLRQQPTLGSASEQLPRASGGISHHSDTREHFSKGLCPQTPPSNHQPTWGRLFHLLKPAARRPYSKRSGQFIEAGGDGSGLLDLKDCPEFEIRRGIPLALQPFHFYPIPAFYFSTF